MKPISRIRALLLSSAGLLSLLLLWAFQGRGQSLESPQADELDNYRQVSGFVDDNETCFTCHATAKPALTDSLTGQALLKEMDPSDILERAVYYGSNHKSFSCLDCHDPSFKAYPHPLNTSQELHWNCLDCHGFDENYVHYQFEAIEEAYGQSIHHLAKSDSFSCWKCHDPHAYYLSIRTEENLATAISYDNEICLSCHDRDKQSASHDWLPNQALHFSSTRCIECHTQINDSMLVAHLVLPAEEAVQNCRECHSRNSILTATLYKHQAAENRNKYGFFNASIMNEAYVIGANQNRFLNRISLLLFGLVFAGILTHIVFRIFKKL